MHRLDIQVRLGERIADPAHCGHKRSVLVAEGTSGAGNEPLTLKIVRYAAQVFRLVCVSIKVMITCLHLLNLLLLYMVHQRLLEGGCLLSIGGRHCWRRRYKGRLGSSRSGKQADRQAVRTAHRGDACKGGGKSATLDYEQALLERRDAREQRIVGLSESLVQLRVILFVKASDAWCIRAFLLLLLLALGVDDGEPMDVDLLQICDTVLQSGLHLERLGVRGHDRRLLLLLLAVVGHGDWIKSKDLVTLVVTRR